MLSVTALMVILNIIPRLDSRFADIYMKGIFAPMSGILSRISGVLPFSLGELMIAAGILLLIITPIMCVYFGIKKKRGGFKFLRRLYCYALIFILVTETLNCFMLYHTTEFSEKYHGGAGSEGFTSAQLTDVCREVITEANALSTEVQRDESGRMIVPENMTELADTSMNILSREYPELSGNCPQPKRIVCSMLMTQLDLQGVYFPFSLEANYNSELSPARVPCTIMHELSHVKGFIREDEASFIAYRACIVSDSPEVRYSGYLSAMNYLLGAARDNAPESEVSSLYSMISPQVRTDNTFVSEEFKVKIEEKAVLPTEAVSAFSERAMETTLKLNGVSDGKKSYNRMVDLILEYHYYIED